MVEELSTDLGSDIHTSWDFIDGDLKLISDEENICQSISNRLNNANGCFDLYYNEYGSYLQNYLGWKQSDETISFMKTEIEETLKQDGRFSNTNVELEYTGNGKITGNIQLTYNDETESTLNVTINEEGEAEVEEDGS